MQNLSDYITMPTKEFTHGASQQNVKNGSLNNTNVLLTDKMHELHINHLMH